MAEERVQRRLAAILAADVVGYSRPTERDKEGTIAPRTDEHRGTPLLRSPALAPPSAPQ